MGKERNPYHVPAGSPEGGQFTSGQLNKIENAAREAAGLPGKEYFYKTAMFKKRKELDEAKNESKRRREKYERDRVKARKESNKEYWNRIVADDWKELNIAEQKQAVISSDLKILEKQSSEPLDPGNWIKNRISETTYEYSNISHPEYGSIKVYQFGGWHMQRVAANYAVEFGDGKYEWFGSDGRDRLKNFLLKNFGIQ
jgi:hypothetical protein